jgi:asparagine synthase (glutamine-hydrolysing)
VCGIGVWFDPRPSAEGVERVLRLHAPIRHRGPDDEGFLFLAGDGTVARVASPALAPRSPITVGMAFRRLEILDLRPEAAQPMGSPDGSAWLVFNGEIYNFRELRAELEAGGRRFRSHGDTEVLLAAYERWGEGCFARLEGMWALAILDLRKRRLVISRDRFGIKPLYWALRDGALLLASEAKQILQAQGGRPAPNRPLVEMYLRGTRYPFVEETFFDGIFPAPPAGWASWALDAPPAAPVFHPYWALADHVAHPARAIPYPEAVDRVEETLTRAVASHKVADVEVGSLLSGGLDSAVLMALAKKKLGLPLPTFSLGFREAAPRYCELRFVDALVKDAGLTNHETTLDAGWVAANIDRVLSALEEPPLAMPALAQYRVFELVASRGLRVVLDGQGADEIVAGYAYHQRAFLKDRLVHGRWLAFAAEARAIAAREGGSPWSVVRDHFVAPRLRPRRPYDWIAAAPPRANLPEVLAARGDFGHDPALVNRQLYYDMRWGNAKIILGYGDRSAMAHSVEGRVPYYDRAFVELLFSLPDDYKVSRGDRKRVLRDVARRWVPPVVTERADRMGFGIPDEEMIRGPLAAHVETSLLDSGLLHSGAVEPEEVRRFHADFTAGRHQDHRAIWRLFSLARWSRLFEVSW